MARKATRKVSASGKTARRQRREFRPRNPRTYYAMSSDGLTLIRFGSHSQRLGAMRAEKLKPIGALDYRNRIAEDYGKNKLTLLDRRDEAEKETPKAAPQPAAASGGASVDQVAEALAKIQATLAQLTQGNQARISGEQPEGARQVSNRH